MYLPLSGWLEWRCDIWNSSSQLDPWGSTLGLGNSKMKDPDARRDWGQEEKGTTEDDMAGWHHWLDGHAFGWTPGVGDGQGGLACCDSWGHKESDTTERLNWTELNWRWKKPGPWWFWKPGISPGLPPLDKRFYMLLGNFGVYDCVNQGSPEK